MDIEDILFWSGVLFVATILFTAGAVTITYSMDTTIQNGEPIIIDKEVYRCFNEKDFLAD